MRNTHRMLILISLFVLLGSPFGRLASAQADHPELHVEIDIKPGKYPNAINIRSNGVIPVALFGSAAFDVMTVDIVSVRLHPMDRPEGGAPVVKFSFEDLTFDGYKDLIFLFRTQEIGLRTDDVMVCLHGMTLAGEHFCGHDTVHVIG